MTPTFDTLIQDFFCRRLIAQQGVSPRTVEAYRDTFRLLLAYLLQSLHKALNELALADLDAPTVIAFLDHLEKMIANLSGPGAPSVEEVREELSEEEELYIESDPGTVTIDRKPRNGNAS